MQSRPWLCKVCAELSLLGAESGIWGLWRASLDSHKTWNLREEFSSQSGHLQLEHEQHLFLHQIVLTDNRIKKKCSVSNHYSWSYRAWFVQVNASCPLSYSWVFPRKAMPGWQMWHTIYGRPVQFWSDSWRPGWLPWHFSLDPVFTWCLSEHPLPVLFSLPRPLPVARGGSGIVPPAWPWKDRVWGEEPTSAR